MSPELHSLPERVNGRELFNPSKAVTDDKASRKSMNGSDSFPLSALRGKMANEAEDVAPKMRLRRLIGTEDGFTRRIINRTWLSCLERVEWAFGELQK